MFSSSSINDDGGKRQPDKRRKLPQKLNPINLVREMCSKVIKTQSNLRLKFQSLSKKGKLLFSLQLMTLMFIFSAGSSQIIKSVRSDTAGGMIRTERSRPAEVPYSVFMDMVEKSGKVSGGRLNYSD